MTFPIQADDTGDGKRDTCIINSESAATGPNGQYAVGIVDGGMTGEERHASGTRYFVGHDE
jgi:hypothetical protein